MCYWLLFCFLYSFPSGNRGKKGGNFGEHDIIFHLPPFAPSSRVVLYHLYHYLVSDTHTHIHGNTHRWNVIHNQLTSVHRDPEFWQWSRTVLNIRESSIGSSGALIHWERDRERERQRQRQEKEQTDTGSNRLAWVLSIECVFFFSFLGFCFFPKPPYYAPPPPSVPVDAGRGRWQRGGDRGRPAPQLVRKPHPKLHAQSALAAPELGVRPEPEPFLPEPPPPHPPSATAGASAGQGSAAPPAARIRSAPVPAVRQPGQQQHGDSRGSTGDPNHGHQCRWYATK